MSSAQDDKGKGKGKAASPSLATRVATSASALLHDAITSPNASLATSSASNDKPSASSSRTSLNTFPHWAETLPPPASSSAQPSTETFRSILSSDNAVEDEYTTFLHPATTLPPSGAADSPANGPTPLQAQKEEEAVEHVYIPTPSDGLAVSELLNSDGFTAATDLPAQDDVEVDADGLFGSEEPAGRAQQAHPRVQIPLTDDLNDWSGFFERYADEVWGGALVETVREARREVEDAVRDGDGGKGVGQQGSAVERLRMVVGHLG